MFRNAVNLKRSEHEHSSTSRLLCPLPRKKPATKENITKMSAWMLIKSGKRKDLREFSAYITSSKFPAKFVRRQVKLLGSLSTLRRRPQRRLQKTIGFN